MPGPSFKDSRHSRMVPLMPDNTSDTALFPVAGLNRRKPTRFSIVPDAAARARLAGDLGILGIDALRFAGEITPKGREDWDLTWNVAVETGGFLVGKKVDIVIDVEAIKVG